jgi:hypothetical protein
MENGSTTAGTKKNNIKQKKINNWYFFYVAIKQE